MVLFANLIPVVIISEYRDRIIYSMICTIAIYSSLNAVLFLFLILLLFLLLILLIIFFLLLSCLVKIVSHVMPIITCHFRIIA